MGNRLEGKVAVITGSAQGVGRAVAIAMAKEGARVVVNNRAPNGKADAESVAHEIAGLGGTAVAAYGDCSKEEDCAKIMDTCIKAFGTVDILVNNAGVSSGDDLEMFRTETAIEEFKLALFSQIHTCRAAVPHMLQKGWGRVINTSSITAYHYSYKYSTTYSSSKAAVIGFTRLLARSYIREGITANIVMPDCKTRLTNPALEPMMADAVRGWYMYGNLSEEAARHCLDLPEPEEVAPFYVYLASPESGYINGKTFMLNRDITMLAEPDPAWIITRAKENPLWTLEQLDAIVPGMMDRVAPYPPYPPKEDVPF